MGRLAGCLAGLAFVPGARAERELLNLDKNGCAIFGYDPVAFFTLGQPAKGRPEIESRHGGARYWFASKKHQELFEREPSKYLPQFGGYCAYGVSRGALAPIRIEAWQIVNGRLLMQKSERIREDFNRDPQGNLKRADANWPKLVEEKGR